jgi:hypothetical protein
MNQCDGNIPASIDASGPGYRYRLLEPGEIRLAYFSSASVDVPDAPLSCKLIVLPLEEAQEWCALSYVWGESEMDQSIMVDGLRFPIRANLMQALRVLCAREGIIEHGLWIDAICINQGDDAEKAVQIPLMRHIYSRATAVLIYLSSAFGYGSLAAEVYSAMAWMRLSRKALYKHADVKTLALAGERIFDTWLKEEEIFPRLEEAYNITREDVGAFEKTKSFIQSEVLAYTGSWSGIERSAAAAGIYSRLRAASYPEIFPPEHSFWASW